MKRRLVVFVCLLTVLWNLVACNQNSHALNDRFYFRFADDLEREVTLYEKPCRVAVLFSSYAEIWRLAGGEVAVTVGESVTRGFAPQNVILVDAGAGKSINREVLLASRPDFIIASADIEAQVACAELFEQADIPIAFFQVDSFDDYLHMLDICTRITENSMAYSQYGTKVQQQIHDTLSAVPKDANPKILFIRVGSKVAKAKVAGDHFACDMLADLNTKNIADNAPILIDGLSLEEILREDPDCIFISTMGDEDAAVANMESIFSEPAWQSLSAVREGRCHYLPKNLFQYKPNHRWAEAYEYLKELLYCNEE
ncbi:MAG: ABC transporter substrate-binding protein [Ruminococcaceae bacterium]|nr:ABC transporter substrate-binding protein [Oscillospiraceae bacterium]